MRGRRRPLSERGGSPRLVQVSRLGTLWGPRRSRKEGRKSFDPSAEEEAKEDRRERRPWKSSLRERGGGLREELNSYEMLKGDSFLRRRGGAISKTISLRR